jgi:hypothetical protein
VPAARRFCVTYVGSVIPDVKYARNDGVNIAYQVWGEGDRDLLIVMGLISHLDVFSLNADMRRWFERLDCRGSGLIGRRRASNADRADR